MNKYLMERLTKYFECTIVFLFFLKAKILTSRESEESKLDRPLKCGNGVCTHLNFQAEHVIEDITNIF